MLNYKLSRFGGLVLLLVIFTSFVTTVLLLSDLSKPDYYNFLFIVPLTFGLLSLVFGKIYKELMKNLGVTILLLLLFVRMVVSPALMYFGNYSGTIEYNINNNTFPAILLVVYEALCIFVFLYIKMHNISISANRYIIDTYIARPKISRSYKWILAITLVMLAICIYLAPDIMKTYRSITSISSEHFTSQEDAYIVAKYGTSFILKFSLVTGQYLFRALLIIVPGFCIINLARRPTRIREILGMVCCTIPLFFIGGAVARSLIYCICLFLLYNFMFHNSQISSKSIYIIAISGVCVILWWSFKADDTNLTEQFSRRFSAYFSGVNVVSGAFNLPNDMWLKIQYFFNDFLRSIPYGTTIFGLDFDSVQTFFNNYNQSYGQIPTTIGMGYYYFGPIFSPVYSLVFANVAYNAGEFLKRKQFGNPIRCLRLLLMVFNFSMGIVMYNIDILFTSICTLIFPMYIMERIGYKKEERSR